jgi:hypothetical protein
VTEQAPRPRDEGDNRRLADFAGTVVFLLLQAFLWRATLFLVGAQRRGETTVTVALYSGLALLFISIALSVWRVARKKSAWGIAVTGCVVQLVLGGAVLLIHS